MVSQRGRRSGWTTACTRAAIHPGIAPLSRGRAGLGGVGAELRRFCIAAGRVGGNATRALTCRRSRSALRVVISPARVASGAAPAPEAGMPRRAEAICLSRRALGKRFSARAWHPRSAAQLRATGVQLPWELPGAVLPAQGGWRHWCRCCCNRLSSAEGATVERACAALRAAPDGTRAPPAPRCRYAMPPVRKKKKEKKVERTPTPFDPDQGFPREKLDEMLRTLREQLEKAQMDRNQIQVDRVRGRRVPQGGCGPVRNRSRESGRNARLACSQLRPPASPRVPPSPRPHLGSGDRRTRSRASTTSLGASFGTTSSPSCRRIARWR